MTNIDYDYEASVLVNGAYVYALFRGKVVPWVRAWQDPGGVGEEGSGGIVEDAQVSLDNGVTWESPTESIGAEEWDRVEEKWVDRR